ncbi:hypothetical protein P43SY_000892 [Pythium insidiosum]|uniref:Uncharacterized protein n=1 Tax=Pythium insidiosum TaxID=114742 RepID=A0AAD5LE23_PYTIN|nr:hypothetical protein P43SY_000892 [Pythium insidiosum]
MVAMFARDNGVSMLALALCVALTAQRCVSLATQLPFFPAPPSLAPSPRFVSLLPPDAEPADVDMDASWDRYERYLMDSSRSTAFLVLLSGPSACPRAVEREAALEEAADDDAEETEIVDPHGALCEHRLNATRDAVKAIDAATERVLPSIPVVVVSVDHFPQALAKASSPSLLWFPPRSAKSFQRFAHPQTNFLDLSASAREQLPHAISEFLRRSALQAGLTGQTAAGQPSASEEPSMLLPALAVGIYASVTALKHRQALVSGVQRRFFWLVMSLAVMYVALSGTMHSLIKQTPLLYAHPQHGVVFFHPSGRKQFLLEGLAMGSWTFVISLAALCVMEVMPRLPSRYSREELFRIALLVIGGSYIALYIVFISKHRWLAR